MLLQATVMASARSAADNALKCARGVCLDAHLMSLTYPSRHGHPLQTDTSSILILMAT